MIRQLTVMFPLSLQAVDKLHSIKFRSTEEDLSDIASHSLLWCKSDNKKVYFIMEEAAQGTSYATTIKLFQKNKDGRGAYFALMN